jgi:enamine deaminase RidA (YjgF/YER057c/UK114 family)
MQVKQFDWLGREFVTASCEGDAGLAGDNGVKEILARIEDRIGREGYSLDDTVRTRLWGKDRESRDLGSRARAETMHGKARSASASFIAPEHFDGEGRVALDFLAMRSDAAKKLTEYDPPITPLRYLELDGIVFLSGVTSTLPTLPEQIEEIVKRIGGSLEHAGLSWDSAVLVSFFLHRSQSCDELKKVFGQSVQATPRRAEYSFVDGYSAQGKLLEIEVTAMSPVRTFITPGQSPQ